MKYKATISFTGVVSMAMGEVKELDSSLAENLVKVGYLIPLEGKKAEPKEEPVEEVKETKKKSPKKKGETK